VKLLLAYLGLAAVLIAASPCDQPQTPKALWRAPGPMSAQDWTCGPGGCGLKPAPPFRFIKEETGGTSPKVDVRDAKGRTWSVKFGGEAIPECFSSRFVNALGYVAEPTYCIAAVRIDGMGKVRRGVRRLRKPDGTFPLGRFELRGEKEMEFLPQCTWAWNANPFLRTHELAGLKIVMMLLSNWDAKDARNGAESNNGVFRSTQSGKPRLLYSVFDWGASMGSWGGAQRRDKSDCVGYSDDTSHFVEVEGPGSVTWGFSGKRSDDLKAGVGVSDIRWLLPYLERITPDQLRAGLAASGATPRQAGCWASSIEERIRQLRVAGR
jgi:hypothetical protein